MARVNPPGVTEFWWVPTISDVAAPTASELNAGTDLSTFVRGVPSIPESFNTADTSNLSSKRITNIPSTYGGDVMTVTVYLDDATDTAYETLTRDSAGHFVIAWLGLATQSTFAIGDDVWVYPATIGSRPVDPVGDTDALVSTISATNTADANEKFSIAA